MAEHNIDLVRDALQVHVNEAGLGAENGGWLVTHFVSVVGLLRVGENGSTESHVVVVSPLAQPDYITEVLLDKAPEVLAESSSKEYCEEIDED